jgi:hypothetical protein
VTAVRFALDEHLSSALAEGLRRRSIEAATFTTLGRAGFADEDQSMWGLRLGWIIARHDDDYIALARTRPAHAGIAYCHANKYNLGGMLRAIERAVALKPVLEEWNGEVVFL